MAVGRLLSADSAMIISPRTSFPHDISTQKNTTPIEKLPPQSDSSRFSLSFEFDFRGDKNLDQDFCTADELFSDGRILPVGLIKKNMFTPSKGKMKDQPLSSMESSRDDGPGKDLKALLKRESFNAAKVSKEDEKGSSKQRRSKSYKPIWETKQGKNSSTNCRRQGPRFCPLSLLFRSRSARSQDASKQSPLAARDCGSNRSRDSPERIYRRAYTWSRSYSQANTAALNVPLAEMFCFGSAFSGGKERRRWFKDD